MEQNSIDTQLKYQLKGHKGAIYYLEEGSDNSKVLSAGADRQIIEWDVHTGEGRLIANSAATVMSMFYMREKDLLFIGQTEGGVHLIDLKSKKELKYLKGHESYIFDILFLPKKNEVVFTCADGSISVWSTDTYEMLYKRSLSSLKLRKMDLSPDHQTIALARGDKQISLLNTEDFSIAESIATDSPVNVVRFSPEGDYLLFGDKEAHLHKLELSTLNTIKSLPAHYWAIYDIGFSPDQRFFATASRDKIVKLWDVEELKVLARLESRKIGAHTHSVNSLLWLNDQLLVSAGDDGDLRVWSLKAN